ncbi:MAG: transcription-repair coupling factor [Ruminiclostridium sp.]|jgi:transcription-repair coupling factor (superfamily II helicase)|nr:transcription-repair coupling factor [Ruminiclostridium sp.]
MPLKSTALLPSFLTRHPDYARLLEALERGRSPLALSGLSAVHRAHLAAGLQQSTGRPLVLVCADEAEARRMSGDLCAFTGQEVPLLCARDFCFHPSAASRQWEHQRLERLGALTRGNTPVLVATIEGLLQRTLPPKVFADHCRTLQAGKDYDLTGLTDFLAQAGYSRCDQVEGVGQFALRGGILDVYSPGTDLPLRLEFWGDTIDSMAFFDPVTQRRGAARKRCTLLPAREVLGASAEPADLELPQLYPQLCSAADYLPKDALVALCDTSRIHERVKSYLWQLGEDLTALLEEGAVISKDLSYAVRLEDFCKKAPTLLYLDAFSTGGLPLPPAFLLSLTARQLTASGLSFDATLEDLRAYQREDFAVVVLTSSRRKADNLQAMLREQSVYTAVDELLHQLPEPGRITIAVGDLSAGFDYPDARCAVLAEGAAPAPKRQRRQSKVSKDSRQRLESFTDLSPGDLVVHEHHGIGRFLGLVKMNVDRSERDYLKLQFAASDVLYVPALQLDLVSKYIGSGDDPEKKRLSRLGGTAWERDKARAKKAAKDMAKGLIKLYAQRQRLEGHAFGPDTPWQQEFEALFPYPETDDQLRSVQEIKADMERPTPMDRLLCGDVGYGKTEVAFRAVMKCVLEGKQAAILVPTTVLAQQHYMTALNRFARFPVSIEMISRYRTAAQVRDILRRTAQGSVDLLVGTHKLLGKDIRFRDLGLLVVDEEQRFGVSHKEKLKQLAHQVDVLTLSATPIPRTLNMALSGLRDMSVLEQAPANRQPVQTYVLEHDWGILSDAMRRELERGGQVYYLHNHTESIAHTAHKIQELLGPEVRIAVGHGRLDQEELSDIMGRMSDGEVDILVCTTIIETGVDLPNVNTLIVENADSFGLSQLHQLRGRVGRSARRAFAYLTYRPSKVLTQDQSKRLSAIREYASFGSGFKIAMRDLEIRGAGNLLGPEQSGFLMSVGYDLYLRLLEEAVLEEQGKAPAPKSAACTAELSVPASIPEHYIPSPEQRMDLYRRIARVHTQEEGSDILDELIDRYGDPPKSVGNLITIALLRAKASRCGITELAQGESLLRFSTPEPDFQVVAQLCSMEKYAQRLLFSAGDKPHLALRLKKGDDVLKLAGIVLTDWEQVLTVSEAGQ